MNVGRAFAPIAVGGRAFPSPLLVALAAVGGALLLVVATTAWPLATDEQAYWRAAARFMDGGSMYDPTAVPGDASYGYWYPPPFAQVLAPLTDVISSDWFAVAWTVVLLASLWWLGGRNPLVALALIAYVPVAVELRARNVHLPLAVLAVLALRRSPLFWIPAAAIKVTPVLGVAYLAAARRWREAVVVAIVGSAVLLASVALAPTAWREFFSIVVIQAPSSGASILPVPFLVRAVMGLGLALLAGHLAWRGRSRAGEAILVGALILANPTLWVTALSLAIALVPLWRTSPPAAVRVPATLGVQTAA
jgi:Glycosyltransferase family 87